MAQSMALTRVYAGWDVYHNLILKALAPLTPEQLALSASPDNLRTIGQIAAHMIGARARWLYEIMDEGNPVLAELTSWDRGQNTRNASELVRGLTTSWQELQACLERWTVDDLDYVYRINDDGQTEELTRQWILWHLIEHDLHHGGELSFSLGMHNLAAPNL